MMKCRAVAFVDLALEVGNSLLGIGTFPSCLKEEGNRIRKMPMPRCAGKVSVFRIEIRIVAAIVFARFGLVGPPGPSVHSHLSFLSALSELCDFFI